MKISPTSIYLAIDAAIIGLLVSMWPITGFFGVELGNMGEILFHFTLASTVATFLFIGFSHIINDYTEDQEGKD